MVQDAPLNRVTAAEESSLATQATVKGALPTSAIDPISNDEIDRSHETLDITKASDDAIANGLSARGDTPEQKEGGELEKNRPPGTSSIIAQLGLGAHHAAMPSTADMPTTVEENGKSLTPNQPVTSEASASCNVNTESEVFRQAVSTCGHAYAFSLCVWATVCVGATSPAAKWTGCITKLVLQEMPHRHPIHDFFRCNPICSAGTRSVGAKAFTCAG